VDPVAAAEGTNDQVVRSLCDTALALSTEVGDYTVRKKPFGEAKQLAYVALSSPPD
jgi:hypothetical protein